MVRVCLCVCVCVCVWVGEYVQMCKCGHMFGAVMPWSTGQERGTRSMFFSQGHLLQMSKEERERQARVSTGPWKPCKPWNPWNQESGPWKPWNSKIASDPGKPDNYLSPTFTTTQKWWKPWFSHKNIGKTPCKHAHCSLLKRGQHTPISTTLQHT